MLFIVFILFATFWFSESLKIFEISKELVFENYLNLLPGRRKDLVSLVIFKLVVLPDNNVVLFSFLSQE